MRNCRICLKPKTCDCLCYTCTAAKQADNVKYSFTVEIDYQPDVDNIYIQLINNWTGEIIASGTSTVSEREATLNNIEYMLREHLPACKR